MKLLLIYPEYEDTFWNVKKVLRLLGKKAAYPPLGLLTVAAMLPNHWEKKLVDMNCEILKENRKDCYCRRIPFYNRLGGIF